MTADFGRAQSNLRVILNEWDPIGVADFAPDDEYDCLIAPLLTKLAAGAGKAAIGEFLWHEVEGHFGLDPRFFDTDSMANRLIAWWAAFADAPEA
jgi:hypothetical protein